MVNLECPWCEAPVALAEPARLRCDDCRIEVEIDPVPVASARPALEVAIAA